VFENIKFKSIEVGRRRTNGLFVNIIIRGRLISGVFSSEATDKLNEICPEYSSLNIRVANGSIFGFNPIVGTVKKKCKTHFGMTCLRDHVKTLKKGRYKLTLYKDMLVCDLNSQ